MTGPVVFLSERERTELRVVSGFPVGGAWASGILMAALFVGLPYAVRWFW